MNGAGEHTSWYVEHIGDGVFETAKYEEHNGQKDGGDFAGDGAGGSGHPNGDTDKKITHNSL